VAAAVRLVARCTGEDRAIGALSCNAFFGSILNQP
jgi:hypothetical protein